MPDATVISNVALTPTLFLLKLKCPASLKFKAGQFVVIHVPPKSGAQLGAKAHKGFYSIASPEQDQELELLVEHREGYLSSWVTERKSGDVLNMEGPMGKFSLTIPGSPTQIFLGNRAGLAPLRSMILTLARNKPDQHVHLFLGAKGSAELLFDAEWRALEKSWDKFHYHRVVQPTADNPFAGKNQDPADELIKKIVHKGGQDIYLAGFNNEVDPMMEKLAKAGFPKTAIKIERFG